MLISYASPLGPDIVTTQLNKYHEFWWNLFGSKMEHGKCLENYLQKNIFPFHLVQNLLISLLKYISNIKNVACKLQVKEGNTYFKFISCKPSNTKIYFQNLLQGDRENISNLKIHFPTRLIRLHAKRLRKTLAEALKNR